MKKQVRCCECHRLMLHAALNPHLQTHGFRQVQQRYTGGWTGIGVWIRLTKLRGGERKYRGNLE